jgi:hypothetical protein
MVQFAARKALEKQIKFLQIKTLWPFSSWFELSKYPQLLSGSSFFNLWKKMRFGGKLILAL